MSSSTTSQLELSGIYEDKGKSIIEFPFVNSFVNISEVLEAKRGVCPLCGKVKALTHEKTNNGYSAQICQSCAIAYVESSKKIDEFQGLEVKENVVTQKKGKGRALNNKPFLVRVKEGSHNHWIDINTGMEFEKLDIPYEEAQHGLCVKTGKKVLKKVVNDGFEPLVLIAKEPTKPTPGIRPITVKFHDADKKLSSRTFESYDIQEVLSGLDEGLNERELAIRVCSNQEAIGKLIEVIGCRGWDLKNEGGDRNGRTKRNKGIERRPQGTNNRACVASRR